jgi:phytoene synthase
VSKALAPAIKDYQLDEALFYEIIDGMEMDLDQNRYADFKELHLYCYRVASVVGQLSAAIFGYTERQTLKYAHDLGLALQLTNIIRDVGEDARRGRIYLPLDELAKFNVSETDILHGHETDNVRKLLEFQIDRAKQTYQRAFATLPQADRRAQRTGLMMAAIYRTLLDEIHRDGCEKVLNQRISLTPLCKLWLVWKTWVFA